MTTFEQYFLEDRVTHKEPRNIYYTLRDDNTTVQRILETFGLNPDDGHVINGHVPVIVKEKERPLKADGKLIVIDGGFARAYQKKTGIAGYTLVFNSWGLLLATHQRSKVDPFSDTGILVFVLRTPMLVEKSKKVLKNLQHCTRLTRRA